MNRLPFLLIGLFCVAFAGVVLFFGLSFSQTSPNAHEYIVHNPKVGSAALLPIAVLLTGVLGFLLWVFALIHLLTSKAEQGTEKIVWALVLIFLNVLGAILYFVLRPFVRTNTQVQ